MNLIIKQSVSKLPNALQATLENRLDRIEADLPATFPTDRVDEMVRVFAGSDFARHQCSRRPAIVEQLITSGDLDRGRCNQQEMDERIAAAVCDCEDFSTLAVALREVRQYEMVRLTWRDQARLTHLNQIMAEVSWLAIACVRESLRKLQSWLEPEYGQPVDTEGRPLDMVVLGMGKLGAEELNFSSDIDLIFCFAEEGQCKGSRGSFTHGQFFTQLAKQLMQLFNEVRENGFVFRVDARLRPFGDSGQLVLSFDAMEAYYERHGREWERYAMIKALPIAGDPVQCEDLMARLRPFVYRRYLDFGSFESLREMKALIRSEVSRKGREKNIKLGAGGIREIEFIGQAFQLIRGGRERHLQVRPIQQVLQVIRDQDLLPDWVVDDLQQAYVFLREAENRLQQWQDQQTHDLPQDETGKTRLAFTMGYADWDAFNVALTNHRRIVAETFEQVFAAPQVDQKPQEANPWQDLWMQTLDEADAESFLQQSGIEDSRDFLKQLENFRQGAVCRTLSARGRTRLDALMPMILGSLQRSEHVSVVLQRVIRLLEATARRTAYLSLLVENPMALSQLGQLLDASPWIADLLTRMPVLMDELLDARKLYDVLGPEALATELESRFERLGDDIEVQMDVLRQFRQANVLRVAAAEITGVLPVNKVSDQLTYVAEAVLNKVYQLAWEQMVQKHGEPQYEIDGVTHTAGFAIIAYGKLGGLELGFGSDLDLVFLHDSHGQKQQTSGDKCLDNAVFFARLGQRIISLLSTQTTGGKLYEVDTRLRPSGGSGLLVSSLNGFREYQFKDAWVWEHQSLVRARPVTGSAEVAARFSEIRREVLGQAREPGSLRDEVVNMRQKMRTQLDQSNEQQFDLKQGLGGIADIEFMIQFLVLNHAARQPLLLDWSDNLRQLETLAETNLLTQENAKMLSQAYLAYRHRAHKLSLQNLKAVVDNSEFADSREFVTRMWREILG